MIAKNWQDYEIIATGAGEKLERWGEFFIIRPDPQAIWPQKFDFLKFKHLHARYIKKQNQREGEWIYFKKMPAEWQITYKDYKFTVMPMKHKHLGIFPEQAINWDICHQIICNAHQNVNVLNLFAYTGGASVACARAGARVTHVDAVKGIVERAGKNARLNNTIDKTRFIIDDCIKFVNREIKRGVRYDAIIMDPPSYGRGPNGETWQLEQSLYNLVSLSTKVLTQNPLFFLINSYTTGLQPTVTSNMLRLTMSEFSGLYLAYELTLPTSEGIPFPCGCSGLWLNKSLSNLDLKDTLWTN